jgi:hypothetical protein
MARGASLITNAARGEKNTSATTSLTAPFRFAALLVRVHYLFLSPLVILSIPSEALLGQNLAAMVVAMVIGLAGSLLQKRRLTLLASASLLSLLIWGKIVTDLAKGAPPDTAVFLVEFGMILFFLEAVLVVLTFNKSLRDLESKEDQLSKSLEERLRGWLRSQISRQGMIGVGSIGLSVVLLPLAGLTSISVNDLSLTAGLLLLAVVVLLFLVTHHREP